MNEKYEIISKKEYAKPIIPGYVWLQQYMLIRRGEKKYAVLRFSNDLGTRIDKLFFTLEQIDSNGRTITVSEREHVVCVGLEVGVAFEKELAVDRECVAIRLCVDKVHARGNEYSLQNGALQAVADIDAIKRSEIPTELLIPKSKSGRGGRWKLIAIALAAVMTVLEMNLFLVLLQALR